MVRLMAMAALTLLSLVKQGEPGGDFHLIFLVRGTDGARISDQTLVIFQPVRDNRVEVVRCETDANGLCELWFDLDPTGEFAELHVEGYRFSTQPGFGEPGAVTIAPDHVLSSDDMEVGWAGGTLGLVIDAPADGYVTFDTAPGADTPAPIIYPTPIVGVQMPEGTAALSMGASTLLAPATSTAAPDAPASTAPAVAVPLSRDAISESSASGADAHLGGAFLLLLVVALGGVVLFVLAHLRKAGGDRR